MKQYRVYFGGLVSMGTSVVVEAENEEQAVELAEEKLALESPDWICTDDEPSDYECYDVTEEK